MTPAMRARRRETAGGLPGIRPATPDPVANTSDTPTLETPQQSPEPATGAPDTPTPEVPEHLSEPEADAPEAAEINAGEVPAAAPTTEKRKRAKSQREVGETDVNVYVGARARQFNLRLLDPLKDRYEQLARQLRDEGVDTSMTELIQALMHEGPHDTGQARELLRRWRQATSDL